jgi:hypothetical protein
VLNRLPIDIEREEKNITKYELEIEKLINLKETNKPNGILQLQSRNNPKHMASLKHSIEDSKKNIDNHKLQRENYLKVVNWNYIETDVLAGHYPFAYFVPQSLEIIDSATYTKIKMEQCANEINQVGISSLTSGTFAKIQVVQDRWFNSTHQLHDITENVKDSAIEDYNKLKELIKIFLDTDIGRTEKGDATLFNFPLGQSKLSNGQKILLQFCLAIYSQETALKDLILVLDEPENHLHPSIIIETIDRVKKCVPNGQIWIATHSIPLLAHFDPSAIWFVNKGKISYGGKIPGEVLESLLGDENEIAKLHDFIGLPAQLATSRYAFESLFEPPVSFTSSDDPQSLQIRDSILKIAKSSKLKILDYGVGKGRLVSNLADLELTAKENLLDKIDFIGYDEYDTHKVECINTFTRVFGNSEKKYYNEYTKLISDHAEGTFDVIIMCNVLHEIDTKDWLKLFRKDGLISSLLSKKGLLLLVEDQQIPTGEKAYQKGFLVFDTPQLKKLFNVPEDASDFIVDDSRNDGRLKAHFIPYRFLIKITDKSRRIALEHFSKIAEEKILNIRKQKTSYSNGKIHGFWVQQLANAQLNLTEFTTKKFS